MFQPQFTIVFGWNFDSEGLGKWKLKQEPSWFSKLAVKISNIHLVHRFEYQCRPCLIYIALGICALSFASYCHSSCRIFLLFSRALYFRNRAFGHWHSSFLAAQKFDRCLLKLSERKFQMIDQIRKKHEANLHREMKKDFRKNMKKRRYIWGSVINKQKRKGKKKAAKVKAINWNN